MLGGMYNAHTSGLKKAVEGIQRRAFCFSAFPTTYLYAKYKIILYTVEPLNYKII